MSSSDRRTVLGLLAALPLAACGFEPVYGPGGPAQGLVDRVRVDDPGDRNSFTLVERLEERLGRTREADLRLSYGVSVSSTKLGLTARNAVSRYNLDGVVTYNLISNSTGKTLTSGRVNTFVSFSASGTTVATNASEADAYERLMRLLADQIVNELIASSGRWGTQ